MLREHRGEADEVSRDRRQDQAEVPVYDCLDHDRPVAGNARITGSSRGRPTRPGRPTSPTSRRARVAGFGGRGGPALAADWRRRMCQWLPFQVTRASFLGCSCISFLSPSRRSRFFLFGRRGRLHLWHVAALVLLTALLLLPAVACVGFNSRPEAWFSVMWTHASGSPGVFVMGMHRPAGPHC